MTERSNGRKTSGFPALTSLPGDAVLSFISGGVNYQITLADYLDSLGVTGSIVQDGAVTGIPVLDVQGAVNNIRNIEPGAGVSASVSPENGLIIKHNFQAGSGGQHLLTGTTNASPMIGDIIAGTNITLSAESGGVKVSNTKVPPLPANVVLVSSMSDFPAAVASVRTLAADTYYYILADLTTSDRFNVSNGNITLISFNSEITYSGSGDMFTGSDCSFSASRIKFNSALGRIFNFSDAIGNALINLENVTITNCDKIGLISGTNFGEIRISGLNVVNVITDGLDFGTAVISKFSCRDSIIKASGGHIFKLGTAVFTDFTVSRINCNLNGAAVRFISGAASSANVASGSLATVMNVKKTGSGTLLSTIAVTDYRWWFTSNNSIQDSRPSACLTLSANADPTTFASPSTPKKLTIVSTSWVDQGLSHFTATTDGKLTYTGEKPCTMSVTICTSGYVSGATDSNIVIYVGLNGAAITASGMLKKMVASVGQINTNSTTWRRSFNPGDYIELWVANNTGTHNLLIIDAIIQIS